MVYLTTLRILKKLIFLSGHLIICSIRNNFGHIMNDFEYILNLIGLNAI